MATSLELRAPDAPPRHVVFCSDTRARILVCVQNLFYVSKEAVRASVLIDLRLHVCCRCFTVGFARPRSKLSGTIRYRCLPGFARRSRTSQWRNIPCHTGRTGSCLVSYTLSNFTRTGRGARFRLDSLPELRNFRSPIERRW